MSLNKNNSIVEEALLQMKSIEEAISENAKGILASTMKEEISELIKESIVGSKKSKRTLFEQDAPEVEEPEEVDVDDNMGDFEDEEDPEAEVSVDDVEDDEVEVDNFGAEGDNEMEMPPLDMTSASPSEILKVFKAMGDEDGIIVKKENDYLHLSDNDQEYIIQMNGVDNNMEEPMANLEEGVVYELEMEDHGMEDYGMEDYGMEDYGMEDHGMKGHGMEDHGMKGHGMKGHGMKGHGMKGHGMEDQEYNEQHNFEDREYNEQHNFEDQEYNEQHNFEDREYNEQHNFEDREYNEDSDFFDLDSIEVDDFGGEGNEQVYEIDQDELESVVEAFKAIGIGMGKVGNGFGKSSVNHKGFKDDMANGTKSEKRGKGPKFNYGKIKHGVTETDADAEETFEGWEMEEDFDMVDIDTIEGMMEPETTEASRNIAYKRRSERGRVTAPSQLRKESVNAELNLLQEKNEEYKKALNFFRTKLNEVAVFNSNLAYATRLFTEHSTTKQEKINILRRFDNVESIKESKNLYKSIKNEVDGKSSEMVTESVQTKVSKSPANGSSANLIESKTYENPQFMRMRDLMTKIK